MGVTAPAETPMYRHSWARRLAQKYRSYMREYMRVKRPGFTGTNKVLNGRGEKIRTSDLSVPNAHPEAKNRHGSNKLNLEELSNWYLTDRINTKGLTHFSQITIEGHFRQLKKDFKEVPSLQQLSEWLGKRSLGGRKRLFETFRAFGRWLEKKKAVYNPWSDIEVPRVPIPLLKAPSSVDVKELFTYLDSHYDPEIALRNKTIIAMFMESGLRLFELSSINLEDIDWIERTVRVWGKGRKEGKAPFGETSGYLLKAWLSRYNPNGGNIWGIDRSGVQVMLKRLNHSTGIVCNPHSFRRAFACILRKEGVDSMTIKDLGRWESLEMVQRYTRSVTFQDSLKCYKAPLG
jgi:site-specific recombinase XerD